jgi:hypothetical protein
MNAITGHVWSEFEGTIWLCKGLFTFPPNLSFQNGLNLTPQWTLPFDRQEKEDYGFNTHIGSCWNHKNLWLHCL